MAGHSAGLVVPSVLPKYDENLIEQLKKRSLHDFVARHGTFGSAFVKNLSQYDFGSERRMIEIGRTSSDPVVSGEWPALITASYHGDIDKVQQLLNTKLVSTTSTDGTSALMVSSCNGHTEVVRLLIEYGADINMKGVDKAPALFLASQEGHSEVVALLLAHGAQPDMRVVDGATALYLASFRGHHKVAELLLDNGAKPNICENDGASPLMAASQNGHTDVVKLLIEHGADINIEGAYNEPALYTASRSGQSEVVELLLAHGAQPDMENVDGI